MDPLDPIAAGRAPGQLLALEQDHLVALLGEAEGADPDDAAAHDHDVGGGELDVKSVFTREPPPGAAIGCYTRASRRSFGVAESAGRALETWPGGVGPPPVSYFPRKYGPCSGG
jgi:hypothetical protein